MDAVREQKQLSIMQNMSWNMMGSLTGLVCQYLITVFVVRLSADFDSAGLYSLAMSINGIFSPIAQYGIYTYQTTDVRDENTLGEYVTFILGTNLVSLAFTFVYAALTCRPNALPIVLLYGVYKSCSIVLDILHSYNQKKRRMDINGISMALQGVASIVAFCAAFGITGDLSCALIAMTVGVVAVGVLYDLPATKRLTSISLGITPQKATLLFKACLPIVAANIAYGSIPSIPRQFLSSFQGDAALGIYASVAAPVAIVQAGATYIYNPLISYFAEYYVRRDKSGFVRLLKLTVVGIIVIGVVCVIGVALFAEPVLRLLYGQTVAEHTYLMYPLVVSSLSIGTLSFLNNLFVAMRTSKSMLVTNLVALVVTLGLSVPLIMSFDMNGVTYALIVSCLAGIVYASICIRVRLQGLERDT